jgi:protein-S-isoprenylcysteine O-methyltransferase Ste14
MNLKTGSLIAFGVAILGMVFLIKNKYVLSYNPITIFIQLCSVGLIIWARITFGLRSFHASANTTKGKLITNGPYKWFRHPIYAAVIYFFWASVISYPFIQAVAAVILITAGLFMRMIFEEKSLLATYDEYAAYSKRTKRIIPFIF